MNITILRTLSLPFVEKNNIEKCVQKKAGKIKSLH